MKRPKIEYPCKWEYRIICADETALRQAMPDIVKGADFTMNFSKSSKDGKYLSFELTVTVNNENARDDIYIALRKHPSVKIVL